jgi:predicted  nucleic acid-binding Zn-ribbon protein
MANRAELEAAVNEGAAVEVAGHPHPIRKPRDFKKAFPDDKAELEGIVARDASGRLTHDGMKAAIARGESVMYEGEIITRIEDLPHPADLAKGDHRKLAAVEAHLDSRQAALDAERQRVAAARKQAEAQAKAAEEEAEGAEAKLRKLPKDQLEALCDEHGCEKDTKPEMAAALAAKGVTAE